MFNKNLQKLREKHQISQEQLADKIGVSRQSVSAWESGKSSPDLDKIIEISKLFKVDIDSLVSSELKTNIRNSNKETYINRITTSAKINSLAVLVLGFGISGTLASEDYGIFILLSAILVAAVLFIFEDNFKKETIQKFKTELKKDKEEVFSSQEISKFKTIKTFGTALVVAFILLFVMSHIANSPVVISSVILTIGIAINTYTSKIYLTLENFDKIKHEKLNQKLEIIWGITMLTTTVVFLIIGMLTKYWSIAAILYPAAALFGVIASVYISSKHQE